MHLAVIADDLRRRYNLPAEQKGAVVSSIAPLSTADDRGLHAGDIIVKVQMADIGTPDDLLNKLASVREHGGHYVLLLVRDQLGNRSIALPLGNY